jgi:glycosyltransferase involved in cell wall biosynthesis
MQNIPESEKTAPDIQAPLATIIIVNHNYGEFVGRCIRSVDQQDYLNIQCIILDCASTDDSLSAIEEALGRATKPVFQVIQRNVNQGHLVNCLSALDHAKGTFLNYLDADDFLFPEFVSTHIKAHLNDLNSAALSVTDQIQVDETGQVLAGTCHWHQKWRAFEQGTAWTDLTHARTLALNSSLRMEQMDAPRLYYIPAWWSSWLMERWIWSATSGIVFRKSVIESFAPSLEQSKDLRLDLGFDGYFARLAHSVGGTLVVDSAQGAYRRHGKNLWSSHPVLGGQTPNGSRDQIGRFQDSQRVARHTLMTKHRDLARLLGAELYYSIAWQLMSNQEFLAFVQGHEEDRTIWEKTIAGVGATKPWRHRALFNHFVGQTK